MGYSPARAQSRLNIQEIAMPSAAPAAAPAASEEAEVVRYAVVCASESALLTQGFTL